LFIKFLGGLDKQDCISLLKESAIMKSFDHPNVLGLVGISLNTEDGTPMIVIPFMKYGDLKTFLVSKRKQTKAKNSYPEVSIIGIMAVFITAWSCTHTLENY